MTTDPERRWLTEQTSIRMPYLADTDLDPADDPELPIVRTSSARRVRRVAEQLAVQFHRETRFDFVPYRADWRDVFDDIVLLSRPEQHLWTGRLVCGAVAVTRYPDDDPEQWWAAWIYLHPYMRGRGVVDKAWPRIADRYPGIRMAGPFTPAGLQLARRLDPHEVIR